MTFFVALIFIPLFSNEAFAQISDASFFPAMRSINPGVAHLRKVGFLSADVNKKDIKKQHDVSSLGILDGIKTETIRRSSDTRIQKNEASSTFHSFLLDFRFFGVSYVY